MVCEIVADCWLGLQAARWPTVVPVANALTSVRTLC